MDFPELGQATVIQSPSGTMWSWTPAPGVFVTRVQDKLPVGAVNAITDVTRKTIAAVGHIENFHDWEKMTDYDTEDRVKLTELARVSGSALRGIHLLIGSRIVAFGAQIAGSILGNMHTYTNRASFESALRSAIARAHR
jgi:hypothetical protein